jgi:hypothetical protein
MLAFERLRAVRLTAAVVLVAAVLGCAPTAAPAALPAAGPSPVVQVSEGSARWLAVGAETSYDVAVSTAPRGSDDRTTTYLTVPRTAGEAQSYRPDLAPGQTVWVGVSADAGQLWSTSEAILSSVPGGASPGTGDTDGDGDGLAAGPLGDGSLPQAAGEASSEQVEANEAPPAPPPPAPPPPAPPPPTVGVVTQGAAQRIVGVNDGAGWGPEAAARLRLAHIAWDRVEIGTWAKAVSSSLAAGFKVLAITNNVNDGTPLSLVEPKAWGEGAAADLVNHPGVALAEAANEAYLKGGVANPAQYGRMYLAALSSMHARGIHTPLLFNMIGDYPRGSWSSPTSWSKDSGGGGWLRDAVNANRGLGAAILANGISIHPYGAVGANKNDTYGTAAPAADEAVARAVLGSVPPFYITEFGYDLRRCGSGIGACSLREQATKLREANAAFAADPHVAGIWWYQSHDDSTGRFGLMNTDGTVRPAFRALSAIAVAAGQ